MMRATAGIMLALMLVIGLAPRVDAGFVPTSASAGAVHAQDLESVQKIVENKLVTARLADLGYSAEEVQVRLAQLSDEEVHALAGQLDAVESGGIIGAIIVILVVAILVILVLRLTDTTVTVNK
jgi:tetrahydromethanopterin S-methyltransferase subunit B